MTANDKQMKWMVSSLKMIMTSMLDAISSRRSNYVINGECPLTDAEITEIVQQCIKHTPSMFNMQSTRAILLLGDHHRYLWDSVIDNLGPETLAKQPNVASEHFDTVRDKVETLKGSHGTVLFFEDINVVKQTKDKYPAYADKLDTWSSQSSAIAQYAVWLAMTEAAPGLGLTLQHYYPDMAAMRSRWDLPESWAMTGQMPFGMVVDLAKEKAFVDEAELVRVFA